MVESERQYSSEVHLSKCAFTTRSASGLEVKVVCKVRRKVE